MQARHWEAQATGCMELGDHPAAPPPLQTCTPPQLHQNWRVYMAGSAPETIWGTALTGRHRSLACVPNPNPGVGKAGLAWKDLSAEEPRIGAIWLQATLGGWGGAGGVKRRERRDMDAQSLTAGLWEQGENKTAGDPDEAEAFTQSRVKTGVQVVRLNMAEEIGILNQNSEMGRDLER